jgi:hypothetical protein
MREIDLTLNNGIMYAVFNCKHVTEQMIDDVIRLKISICGKDEYPQLADARKVRLVTKAARERMVQKDAGENISKVAVWVNNEAQRIIIEFFDAIYHPLKPTKVFTNKEKAIDWLKK